MTSEHQEIMDELRKINILMRVNNIVISKFILQLQTLRKELHLPKLISYWKFELLEDEYVELIKEFNRSDVDKALWYLDRQLVDNKMDCPNNIKKYIIRQLKKKNTQRAYVRRKKEQQEKQENSE